MKDTFQWASKDGTFKRQVSKFQDVIEKGGLFPPAKGRYHLYVSLACPWAHRTLIVRALKRLDDIIGVSVVDYLLGEKGWKFSNEEETPGCIPDPHLNAKYISELYYHTDPEYTARFTVPVLWDTVTQRIVNNESSQIIRILNSEFNEFSTSPLLDLYPKHLTKEIDEINEWVYDRLNNGVYKAGFATSQEAYEENARNVYQGLVRVEKILGEQEFLVGKELTEADIRLYTTTIRFDPVYFGHYKCNLLAIKDCPNILRWMRKITKISGVKETINMTHIKNHYYMSHVQINPSRIVPLSQGPELTEDNPNME